MSRRPHTTTDPIEVAMVRALAPGRLFYERAGYGLVSDLEKVAVAIAGVTKDDPARAAALYETFLAACHEKAAEVDDSGGVFGEFVSDLYCGWTKARQAGRADPDETASRLLGWTDADDRGFCFGMEKKLSTVLNKAGLAAFVRQVRGRFDQAAMASPAADGRYRDRPEMMRRRWGGALRELYLAQNDVAAYLALAEETGLTARDCLVVATMLLARRKPEEALVWVDRGIALEGQSSHGSAAGYDLVRLRRQLLVDLGRTDDALESAWADYRRHPGRYSYVDLMKLVPNKARDQWHQRAMEATATADLGSALELFLETGEKARLAEAVRGADDPALEELSHRVADPVARKLEKGSPDLAARLWRAQGMRIVNAKLSRYYHAALAHFEKAKGCFERAGQDAEWEKTAHLVRQGHKRKTGFMPGFERLAAGSGPSAEPSFLERARTNWRKRERGAS